MELPEISYSKKRTCNNLKISILLKKSILLLFILLFNFSSYSQNLIESRQKSYYTYIYKITNNEAQKIYKKNILKVDNSYFHTLVDSFPTDSQYSENLPQGHYLKTFAEKNIQKSAITTVTNFDVFILNNNTDLCIQIYDLQGNLINDADVSIRMKKIHFNKKTQSYLDKKSNQKGLLKVTYKGFTAFYNLSRKYNNSSIKRGTRKVVYGTPIKYVWLPVKHIIFFPIDGVRTIVKGWPVGTIYGTKDFFVKPFNKIRCLLDKNNYNCDYYSRNRFNNKHTGYIVFNKPKYAPNDTLKFKAFLVTKKGKPVDKKISVILQNYKKDIVLTKLLPYRSGGYKYELYLHDSLQLQLDENYSISLELNKRKKYLSGSFEYEDYELSKNKLTLRVNDSEQYKNKPIKLYAKGTDENDLNLMDARIEILLTPKSINKYFDKHSFFPDTLLFIKKNLNPINETEITISDSTFPNANFEYSIIARLLTSDNESVSESKEISYYYESEKLAIELQDDSIHFNYFKNGLSESKHVNINSRDNFGNESRVYEGVVPCKIEINPYFSSYTIKTDSFSKTINISKESSLLQFFSERTKDSVFFVVKNPRKIPFSYHIYKKNIYETSGFSDSLKIKKKTDTKQNYFLSVRYLWGGKVKEENYRIPLIDKKLTISVTQPKIVYPGQKSKIEILVKDKEGNPIEGVDLTAFSFTKKFDYTTPEIPYLGKVRNDKKIINNFKLIDTKQNDYSELKLDYDSWKILASLDSIAYYQFIYPNNTIYQFKYNIKDSITQFAPFIVSEGAIVPIHVIYADNKPIYFNWSTNIQSYSFNIDSGFHQIKLRTTFKEIIIDSMYFEKGKKLIFSLDQNSKDNKITILNKESNLSDYEKRLLYKYIFPYKNNFGEHFAYLEQEGKIQSLNPESQYNRTNLAGPLSGNLTFHLMNGFSTKFNHEPFYEYEFSNNLLKMRTIDLKIYPNSLFGYNAINSLSDIVLTKSSIEKNWNEYLDSKRYVSPRYSYPNSTKQGAGRLLIKINKNDESLKDIPLNILIFRYDSDKFLRVYPGNTSIMHDLKTGYYKLLFFYSGAKYHIEDSVYVQPNGLNYYEFKQPSSFKKDTFSLSVSNIIEETLFKSYPYYKEEEKEFKQIYNSYQTQLLYKGVGVTIEGYIYDAEAGDPLPGVTVNVKGTTYGTISDLDGFYSITVPENSNTLVFSFVGMKSQEIEIGYQTSINIRLESSSVQLEGMVVVAYGFQKKSNLASSIAIETTESNLDSITSVSGNLSNTLSGKVAGISISSFDGSPGAATSIVIRGASSINFDKTPLYIINGEVYTGDISELDPDLIKNISVLKGENATALYGSSGLNGVVLIETDAGAFKLSATQSNKGADFDNIFYEAASQSSSIRNNFSDYAFWQPSLITNKEGKATFDVVFPDDVTSWQTFYLAMNNKNQSGQTKALIKSYKPLMAQLAIPRFLVQGDSTFAIGKVLNYTPDSVKVKTKFNLNNSEVKNNLRFCSNSLIDTLPIYASSDSLNVKYYLEMEDGYYDGEQREIPVFPKGINEIKGNFIVLDKDTTIQLKFDTTSGKVHLYAKADILEVMEDEISNLINYKYSCNEQLASKLKALLADKNISYFKGEKFKNEKEIEKIITLLKKNKKENRLWGWWKDSEESLWISLHILEALTHAEQYGYKTSIEKNKITELLIWELENAHDFYEKIKILKILNLLGEQINYKKYISDLEKINNVSLNGLLNIIELKQLYGIDYNIDTLEFYKKKTLFGNIFYSDTNRVTNLFNNDIQNTLLAYNILKVDSSINKERLNKIRNYFLEIRKNGYWRNTFESAQIIETILPDILVNPSETRTPVLTFKGDINKTISKFPFEMKINPIQKIEISKSGNFPIYFTSYQNYWNNAPILKTNDFEISTYFENSLKEVLAVGQEIKLITKVIVKKDAEYVMINIPIPGGCSYADKKNNFKNESHREYFKQETAIFCNYLPKGEYFFEIDLISRYAGRYTINPAKVELMYFPTFNANNEIKSIIIK